MNTVAASTDPTVSQTPDESIAKVVDARLDERLQYFNFVQNQIEKDRSFYKHLYTVTGAFIGILLAVAGILFYNSLGQLRSDIKANVDAQLTTVNAESSAAMAIMTAHVDEELANVRTEVQSRVDKEFQTDNIRALVENAAKTRTNSDLEGIIHSEAAAQVKAGIQAQSATITQEVERQTKQEVEAQRPTIAGIIHESLDAEVQKAVSPVDKKLKSYGEIVDIEKQSFLAQSGDRHAFEQLMAVAASQSPDVSLDAKQLANSTVIAVTVQKQNILRRMHVNFKESQTKERMLEILKSSPFVNDRVAALDNLPANDTSVLPAVVDRIQNDNDLEVVTTAMLVFDNLTKQQFAFPDYGALLKWWNENRVSLGIGALVP